MNSIQKNLLRHAKERCIPYLLDLAEIQSVSDNIAFVLVGSVATGLCNQHSDIDIALVCDQSIYDEISSGKEWSSGRPSEVLIDGIQLHYYGISLRDIEQKFTILDDTALYVYTNGIVLLDYADLYSHVTNFRLGSHVRRERIEGKLDMALRRMRALDHCVNYQQDILQSASICLELVRLLLKIIALLEDIDFDPRKRLFSTALSGKLGATLKNQISTLIFDLGRLGLIGESCGEEQFSFPRHCKDLLDILCQEAKMQGFKVGLNKPDKRHVEKL